MEIYPDIPRIYTALAEWLSCMVYCCVLTRKVSDRVFIPASIGFLLVQSAFLTFTGDVPQAFWIPCMMLAVGNMWLFLSLMCDASRRNLIYYLVSAFLLAEFAASLEWQLSCFAMLKNESGLLRILILIGIYTLVFSILYVMERGWSAGAIYFELNRNEMLAFITIGIAVFALSNISFATEKTPFSSAVRMDIFYIRTLVDFAGVIIVFAYKSRISELGAQKELTSINSMLKEQYDKYRSYQSSFEMINIKYHDLKHQIAGLKGETDQESRMKWIDAMEQELEMYKPDFQTGNHVLDTLLAGKMLTCRPHDIKLTCVAEGQLLDFMHVTDICTVFGNALDNAIENVSLINDPEKRLIHLMVTGQKNFVFIQVSNYCEQRPDIRDGRILTTKSDKKNHGYGIKSIRYSVEKYKGNVEYGMNKDWFELKILIPYNTKTIKK